MLDYYAILGLHSGCSAEEIRQAYRTKLKQFHPDIYYGADAAIKTQRINEAYACLSDAARRAAYDKEWRKIFGEERILTEEETLAKLEREFAGKINLWDRQLKERLAQIGKDTETELKAIFIDKKWGMPADYYKLSEKMQAQMRSYETVKKQAIEDYYAAAARPEFEPQALMKILDLEKNAAKLVGVDFTAEAERVNKALNHAFGLLNPDYSEESKAKRQAAERLARDNEQEENIAYITIGIIIAIFIVLMGIAISRSNS